MGIDDSSVHKHAWLLGGSGGIPLGKILNLDPLRLLLMQSGTNFPNNILTTHTCTSSNIDGTTIINILHFKISWGRGGGGGGGIPGPPPLCMKPWVGCEIVVLLTGMYM